MVRVYCIPGLGNDKTMFKALVPKLDVQDIYYLEHMEPIHRKESLGDYAERLKQKIEASPQDGCLPVVIGMSLGGMIAIELAKRLSFEHIFLVSTIKHKREQPWLFRLLRMLPLYLLVPIFFIKKFNKFFTWLGRVTNKAGRQHIHEMVNSLPNTHFHWGHRAAIHWDNEEAFDNITHINGSKDEIFPIRRVKPTHIVEKGNHYMIVDRAEEVAAIINKKMREIIEIPTR